MDYFKTLHNNGKTSMLPSEELVELLEFKVTALKHAKEEDSSWNYGIDDLEKEINKIKGFIELMKS